MSKVEIEVDRTERGDIDVTLNYIKIGQYLNMIKYFTKKIEAEMDRAIIVKFEHNVQKQEDKHPSIDG